MGLSDSIALHEGGFTGKVTVDRQNNLIPGVKILGFNSPSHGRSYTAEALKGARQLYEGTKVFVDHQITNGKPAPRSVRDLLGTFEGVTFQEGAGLFGNLRFNPKHPEAENLLWWAENMPRGLGMSHDASGKATTKDGKQIIESIISVNSVDLVANPATNKGLFESTDAVEENQMDLAKLTEAEIKTGNPALYESITKGATAAIVAENATLKEQVSSLTKLKEEAEAKERLAAKKAKIGELCKESKLPVDQITPVFEAALMATADEAAMKALIEDRAKLAPAAGNRPVSVEQRVAESRAGGTGRVTESLDSFVAMIR